MKKYSALMIVLLVCYSFLGLAQSKAQREKDSLRNVQEMIHYSDSIKRADKMESKAHPKSKGTKDKVDSLLKLMQNPEDYAANPFKDAQTHSFEIPENYSRYSSSPCFNKLGYSPYRSADDLEKMYCDCEREYYINLATKVGLGLLLLGGVGYMVFLSLKRRRDKDEASA